MFTNPFFLIRQIRSTISSGGSCLATLIHNRHPSVACPYSLLPTPYSLLPTPYSLVPTPWSQAKRARSSYTNTMHMITIILAMGLLLLVGLYDRFQTKHSILRNFPVMGHLRFLMESAGPEMHQYFVESNTSGRPFDRDQRSLVYRRAKNEDAVKPFGTEKDFSLWDIGAPPLPVGGGVGHQLTGHGPS